MPVITVATSKGGAGKTTLARVLLGHAAQYGHKVGAVDTDLNHSLMDWAARCSKVPITVRAELDENRVASTVEDLSDAHDFIVIDTAGAASRATVFAVGIADLVLIPAKMSDADIVEAIKTFQLVTSTAKMLKRPVLARVVLTAFRPRTQIAAHIENLIREAKLPLLKTRLHDLVAFPEMTFDGKVPQSGVAGIQVSDLFDEAMTLIEQNEKDSKRLAS